MRITATLPDHGAVIEAVLEGFVQAAQVIVDAGLVAPSPQDMGIRYQEESGTERWMLPNQVVEQGWGDCEDLCIWTAAGLRSTGEDPDARCVLRQTGRTTIHCLVERGDGSLQDPSRDAMSSTQKQRYGLSGVVIVKDHRTADHRPTRSTPDMDPITKYMVEHNVSNLVIDTGGTPYKGQGPGNTYGTPRNMPLDTSYFTPQEAKERGLLESARAGQEYMSPQGTDAIRQAAMASAQYVGDRMSDNPGVANKGGPRTKQQADYYTTDPQTGQVYMVQNRTGYIFDPSTGRYYDPKTTDPYTGGPQELIQDPTTGQLVPGSMDDPYGGGYGYDPYGYGYGGQYGYPTEYGYDPFYRGAFPDAYASGTSYDDMPLTYGDLYYGFSGDDEYVDDDSWADGEDDNQLEIS